MIKSKTDLTRGLALLWGPQNIPSRSGLTVKRIVEAGIEIADSNGIVALSMRNVAERLGVGTMSLYTHVPGKMELLALMLDAASAGLYEHVDIPSRVSEDWREGLRFIAKKNWELFLQHPWMLEIPRGRPVLGPNESLKYEAELRAIDGIGLTDIEMDATLTLVLMHVESCARLKSSMEAVQKETGVDESEWWLASAPTLDKFIDAKQFPVGTRVGMAAGQAYESAYNPEHAYSFGLERIIAGISALIAGGSPV